jgi:hypothetical protein
VIVVHQMAKVASRSWIEVAKPAAAPGESPVHCHFIIPANMERIEARLAEGAARQTIANMVMPNYILRSGAKAWSLVEAARRSGRKIKVITGMRDPVARSISLMMFFIDFIGHVSLPLNPKIPASAEFVVGALRDNWNAVLERREPDGTFEWLLWFLTGAYASWFDDELQTAYGAEIDKTTFRGAARLARLNAPVADVLVYRVEDMAPDATRHSALLNDAGEFLGSAIAQFPNVNASHTRRSHALSDEVHRQFRLPAEMLASIYAHRIVQHFYAPEEVEGFTRRWIDAPR